MKPKLLLALMSALLLFQFSNAQRGVLYGRLLDTSAQPISYATVAVFDTRDSSVINFGLSDEAGEFELKGIPQGIPARLLVSHVLYQSVLKNFQLDSNGSMQMDSIVLMEKNNELSETVVTWEAPPIVIRNDTVEFNADAFIGRPGSAVEELLKRIPGVEVDENGQVTYNGRKVSKITIDSKQFFSDDPVILMKNIPAKAIEKVQITEEKDERGRATNSGDVSINLTLKHWAKKSHFGKAYAGYGSDNRYEAGGIWSFFRDTLQVSIIGYGNNLSQTGFSFGELYKMGGFDRSGVSTAYVSQSGLSLNGTSFGGGKGITESAGGGFNLNYAIPQRWSLSGSYFIGFTRTNYLQNKETNLGFVDSTLQTRSLVDELSKSSSHSLNAKLQWTPDTIHLFSLTPSIQIGQLNQNVENQNNNSYSAFINGSLINNQLNTGFNNQTYKNDFLWDMRLKKWEYELELGQEYTDNKGDGKNTILLSTYSDSTEINANQFQSREVNATSLRLENSARAIYYLNDSFEFSVFVRYLYGDRENQVLVFEQDTQNGELVFLSPLSTRFHELRQQGIGGLRLEKTLNKGGVIGASLNYNHTELNLLNHLNQNQQNPVFDYLNGALSYYKFSPSGYLNLYYNYATELPESSDLLDLRDNSDANRIKVGNPNLKASQSHGIDFWMRKNYKNGLSLFLANHSSLKQNDIVRESYYDETGVSIIRPVNLDAGKLNLRDGNNLVLSYSIKSGKEWQHRPRIGLYTNYNEGWLYQNSALYRYQSYGYYPSLGYTLSKKDKLDISARFNQSVTQSKTIGLNNWIKSVNYGAGLEIWWAPVEKVWLEVKANYTYQVSVAAGLNNREYTLVNAAATFLMLKENRGQLRLSVFDLLNQNQSIQQFAYSNYVERSQSNAVTRYAMLSFVYNFNSFQKKGRPNRGYSFWY